MTGSTTSFTGARTVTAWIAAGGLVVLAVGAGYVMFRKSAQVSTDIRELRQQLERVKRDRDTERRRPGRTAVRETVMQATVAPPAGTTSSSPHRLSIESENSLSQEERDYRFNVVHEARLQAYEAAFTRESMDAEWAAVARQKLEQKYTGEQFQSLRLSVECRATLCRVGIRFTDDFAAREAVSKLNVAAPWDGRAYASMDTERNEGVSFVAREGFGLPAFDAASVTF